MQLDLLEKEPFELEGIFMHEAKPTFRAIHYLGSKLRMLEFIKSVADDEDPSQGAICDLFSGSGAVSQVFSASRRVIAVDIQEYSKVICTALLNPCSDKGVIDYGSKIRLSPIRETLEEALQTLISYEKHITQAGQKDNDEAVCNFLESGSLYTAIEESPSDCLPGLRVALKKAINSICNLDCRRPLASIYFGGIYFSFEQAVHIDVILEEIKKAPEKFQNTLLAALVSTASDIVNTVGKQFAQPIRPRNRNGQVKPNLLKQLSKDRTLNVFDIFESWLEKYSNIQQSVVGHEVHRMDYKEALDDISDDVRIVYADPPYTRDHYSRFYHALETLCLQDYPEISKTNIGGALRLSRGLYRFERHQSPFCIKSKAPGEFVNLFDKVSRKGKILMLSYSPYDKAVKSHPRVMELEQLVSIAKKYFKYVNKHSPGVFVHSKLNHTEKHLEASNTSEIVLVCRS